MDPHPGNFLLQTAEQSANGAIRLGIVDFGACVSLSDATRNGLRELYAAGMEMDIPVRPPPSTPSASAPGWATPRRWWRGPACSTSSRPRTSARRAWAKLISAATDPLVKLPDELIMVGRVLMVQTGLVARINPSWSMEGLIAERLAEGASAADASLGGGLEGDGEDLGDVVGRGGTSSASRTSSGTSSRSRPLRAGQDDLGEPDRWAASTFCLTPPIGSTLPCSVTSPVMPTVDRTGRPVSRLTSAVVMVTPADGPSLGTAPAGTCTWNRGASNAGGVDAELVARASARRRARSAPTPS